MVETPFEVPAYNGELLTRLDWRKDNTVGSLAVTSYRHDPVTTDPFRLDGMVR